MRADRERESERETHTKVIIKDYIGASFGGTCFLALAKVISVCRVTLADTEIFTMVSWSFLTLSCSHPRASPRWSCDRAPRCGGGVPAVPGVHAQVVEQKPAEVERRFGLLVDGLLLAGGPDAHVGVPPPHLLLLLLRLPQDGLQDGRLLLPVHAAGRGGGLVELELRVGGQDLGLVWPSPSSSRSRKSTSSSSPCCP